MNSTSSNGSLEGKSAPLSTSADLPQTGRLNDLQAVLDTVRLAYIHALKRNLLQKQKKKNKPLSCESRVVAEDRLLHTDLTKDVSVPL